METSNASNEFTANVLSSASAGFVARLFIHPVDTIKSRLQSPLYVACDGPVSVFSKTIKEDGFQGLYRGLPAALVGGVPAMCIYLTVYEAAKQKLSEEGRLSPFLSYLCSGMLAETICCVVFVPVDIIKERMQVQNKAYMSTGRSSHIYHTSIDAVKKIWKYEGITGIYRGYGATLLSYGPFSALYFLFYEEAKKLMIASNSSQAVSRQQTSADVDQSFLQSFCSSAGAGALAALITSPLDLVRLRMQVHGMSCEPSADSKPTFLRIFRDIFRTGGTRGLFRGAGARIMYHTPNVAVTMAVFEHCKKMWLDVLK